MNEENKNQQGRSQIKHYLRQIDDFFEQTPLRGLVAEMNHFFQKGNRLLTFPVDLYEVDQDLVIKAELPGIQKEQIQIEIQGDILQISVKDDVTEEVQHEATNYYRRERAVAESKRMIKLPYPIQKKQARAAYANGILEIRAPKTIVETDTLQID